MISLNENEKLFSVLNEKELFLFDMDGTVYALTDCRGDR